MTDPGAKFSKEIGWTAGEERTGRYALIIDHGKITYAEKESSPGEVSVPIPFFLDRKSTLGDKLTCYRCLEPMLSLRSCRRGSLVVNWRHRDFYAM